MEPTDPTFLNLLAVIDKTMALGVRFYILTSAMRSGLRHVITGAPIQTPLMTGLPVAMIDRELRWPPARVVRCGRKANHLIKDHEEP